MFGKIKFTEYEQQKILFHENHIQVLYKNLEIMHKRLDEIKKTILMKDEFHDKVCDIADDRLKEINFLKKENEGLKKEIQDIKYKECEDILCKYYRRKTFKKCDENCTCSNFRNEKKEKYDLHCKKCNNGYFFKDRVGDFPFWHTPCCMSKISNADLSDLFLRYGSSHM